MHPAALKARAAEIWTSPLPRHMQQLRGLWHAISTWEFGTDKSISSLLHCIRRIRPDNPELRKGETANLWASRYYFLRRRYNWRVRAINQMGLSYTINHQVIGANFHIYYEDDLKCGYVYIKHGEDWDNDDSVAALSCIRAYHEKTLLFKEKQVEFRYVSILEDFEMLLSDEQYNGWLDSFYPIAGIMHEADNA